MLNEEELSELPMSVLRDMLLLELDEVQENKQWSLEKMGEELGLDKATLSRNRRVNLGKASIHKLAFCKYGDLSVIARAMLAKFEMALGDFNLPVVAHLLAHGVGFGESLDLRLPRLSGATRHRGAVAELMLCFTHARFYGELAEARWDHRRAVPIYPLGGFHESDHAIELMVDGQAHWNVFKNAGFNGVLRFSHAVRLNDERRDAAAERLMKRVDKENYWVYDAVDEAVSFRHYRHHGRTDQVLAACAAAQAYICNEVLWGATHILRGDVKRDKYLERSGLGKIASELHKHSQAQRRELRRSLMGKLEELPLEHIKSGVAIAEHVNSMSDVSGLKGLHLGPIYMPTEVAEEINKEPRTAKCLMSAWAPPIGEYVKQGLLPAEVANALQYTRRTAQKGGPKRQS